MLTGELVGIRFCPFAGVSAPAMQRYSSSMNKMARTFLRDCAAVKNLSKKPLCVIFKRRSYLALRHETVVSDLAVSRSGN
jgi:hypothetical protein